MEIGFQKYVIVDNIVQIMIAKIGYPILVSSPLGERRR